MRKLLLLIILSGFYNAAFSQSASNDLRIVIIRHGEKPKKGNNLTCQGLNRALQLPPVLFAKFGVPDYIYAPSLSLDDKTKHARMFETIEPMAIKYNLAINTSHEEHDSTGIASDITSKKGTVLMCWEHHAITSIVKALGIHEGDLLWDDNDYDSIWIITYHNGVAKLTKDKEKIRPAEKCPY